MGRGTAPVGERDWEAEDDLRTLQRAQEIGGDRSRVNRARKVATKQLKALRSISGTLARSKR